MKELESQAKFRKGEKVVVKGIGWEVEAIVEKAVPRPDRSFEYFIDVRGLHSCVREEELGETLTKVRDVDKIER